MLYKEDNFCDFLFAPLHTNSFLKKESTHQGDRLLLRGGENISKSIFVTVFKGYAKRKLKLCVLDEKHLADKILKYVFFFFFFFFVVFFFSRKQVLTVYANCPTETICMKCYILFSGKNKNNIINLLFAEFAHSAASVQYHNK